MNPTISDYMRQLQRRSAKKRWAGLTKEQRGREMSKVRQAGLEKKRALKN